jgi:hypothetical protein
MKHSNFTAAQKPSKRVKSEIYLSILYSQAVIVMTNPATNLSDKRAFLHELLGFLTFSGPWWLLLNFPNFLFLNFSFTEFPLPTFSFSEFFLYRLFLLPTSTSGQASEVSWFPGMRVNRIL